MGIMAGIQSYWLEYLLPSEEAEILYEYEYERERIDTKHKPGAYHDSDTVYVYEIESLETGKNYCTESIIEPVGYEGDIITVAKFFNTRTPIGVYSNSRAFFTHASNILMLIAIALGTFLFKVVIKKENDLIRLYVMLGLGLALIGNLVTIVQLIYSIATGKITQDTFSIMYTVWIMTPVLFIMFILSKKKEE